jgi:hypothetical protein
MPAPCHGGHLQYNAESQLRGSQSGGQQYYLRLYAKLTHPCLPIFINKTEQLPSQRLEQPSQTTIQVSTKYYAYPCFLYSPLM